MTHRLFSVFAVLTLLPPKRAIHPCFMFRFTNCRLTLNKLTRSLRVDRPSCFFLHFFLLFSHVIYSKSYFPHPISHTHTSFSFRFARVNQIRFRWLIQIHFHFTLAIFSRLPTWFFWRDVLQKTPHTHTYMYHGHLPSSFASFFGYNLRISQTNQSNLKLFALTKHDD